MTSQGSQRFVNAEYADRLEAEVAQVRQEREQTEQFLRGRYQQILALEAARDHLRARLQQLAEFVQHKDNCPQAYDARVRWKNFVCTCGLADLQAILTEPPQEEKEHNDNDLAR